MGARLHQCTGPCQGCLGEHAHRPDPLGHQCHPDAGGGLDRLCLPSRGRPDMKYPLLLATMMLAACSGDPAPTQARSEEHTSELQSLMRISYAVFCLKKKKPNTNKNT